ncbi:MAG: hypothetical protein WCA46_11350 [Actinocatenispora sp.]
MGSSGDGTAVDLEALTTFANKMGSSADQQLGDWKSLGGFMTEAAMDMAANSTPGFAESNSFHNFHRAVTLAATQFTNELMEGTATLGAAAETAAINYASADQLSALDLKKIAADAKAGKPFSAMDVVFGRGSSANVGTGDVNKLFNPSADEALPWSTPGAQSGDGKNLPTTALTPEQKTALDNEWNKKVGEARTAAQNGESPGSPEGNAMMDGDGYTVGKAPDTYSIPANQTSKEDLLGDTPLIQPSGS